MGRIFDRALVFFRFLNLEKKKKKRLALFKRLNRLGLGTR